MDEELSVYDCRVVDQFLVGEIRLYETMVHIQPLNSANENIHGFHDRAETSAIDMHYIEISLP
jgi:hypothetical protein